MKEKCRKEPFSPKINQGINQNAIMCQVYVLFSISSY